MNKIFQNSLVVQKDHFFRIELLDNQRGEGRLGVGTMSNLLIMVLAGNDDDFDFLVVEYFF